MNKQALNNGFWAILLLSVLGLTACDREEPLPVYLRLEPPTVEINPGEAARAEVGIKDLWIEHNSGNLGVFRVPRTIPLLPEPIGDQLVIFGGIFENGLSSLRSRYPFWKPIFMDLPSVPPLDTIPLALDFEYYSTDSIIQFPLNESFEGASLTFESQTASPNATLISRTSEDPFEGQTCGKVSFSADQFSFEMISNSAFHLPQRGNNDIYIEISYKNNVPFTAGLYYITNGLDAGELPIELLFNSNMEWNTVYLHLNDAVREAPEGAVFRMYVRASSPNQNGVLYLDNIRIVHFR